MLLVNFTFYTWVRKSIMRDRHVSWMLLKNSIYI